MMVSTAAAWSNNLDGTQVLVDRFIATKFQQQGDLKQSNNKKKEQQIAKVFLNIRSDLKIKIAEDQATMDHLGIGLQFVLSSLNRERLLGIIDLIIQKNLLKKIKNETKGSKSKIWNSTKDGGF
ncbi:hypothetical protein Tco_1313907 [Tanacetum coccineum]